MLLDLSILLFISSFCGVSFSIFLLEKKDVFSKFIKNIISNIFLYISGKNVSKKIMKCRLCLSFHMSYVFYFLNIISFYFLFPIFITIMFPINCGLIGFLLTYILMDKRIEQEEQKIIDKKMIKELFN